MKNMDARGISRLTMPSMYPGPIVPKRLSRLVRLGGASSGIGILCTGIFYASTTFVRDYLVMIDT